MILIFVVSSDAEDYPFPGIWHSYGFEEFRWFMYTGIIVLSYYAIWTMILLFLTRWLDISSLGRPES